MKNIAFALFAVGLYYYEANKTEDNMNLLSALSLLTIFIAICATN